MKFHEKVGPLTIQLCFVFNGWIVGGSVDYLSGRSENIPRDIDIIIPLSEWPKASKILTAGKINSFGGVKIKDGDFEVNVWPEDIGFAFCQLKNNFKAYQAKYNLVIGAV